MERSCLCSHAQRMAKRMRKAGLGGRKGLYSDLRHTSSKRAAKQAMKAVLLWQLGGVKQVGLLSLSEEELCGGEPFDEMHEAMAARALP